MSSLEAAMGSKLVQDGIVSESESQAKALWRLREDTPVSLSAAGAVYKYDLSMPTSSMYAIVDDMRAALPSDFQVFGYGHIGDGNLHLNILVPRYLLPPTCCFIIRHCHQIRRGVQAPHRTSSLRMGS